jgi:glycosyltransferase involved in cell wall biosynthesis
MSQSGGFLQLDKSTKESMSGSRIIGIVLVQNEDLYIERVLSNIGDFCDEIIIADHRSKDRTSEISQNFFCQGCEINYQRIGDPSESHDLISGYAGRPVWIFAVDGDEIYDPHGLRRLRKKIEDGVFDNQWMILGNVLNCKMIDRVHGVASGYLAPPCRSMTKLYNFNAISAWNGPCPERLHGGSIEFKDGYDKSLRLDLYKTLSWDESDFRCLHLCFMRRSSLENESADQLQVRRNISDKDSQSLLRKLQEVCFKMIGISRESEWKKEKYMRGALETKSIADFIS